MDMFDVLLLSDSLSLSQGRPHGLLHKRQGQVGIWAEETGIIALAQQELALDKALLN